MDSLLKYVYTAVDAKYDYKIINYGIKCFIYQTHLFILLPVQHWVAGAAV